jgi:hypothetical protein
MRLGVASAWPWEGRAIIQCWMLLDRIPAESPYGGQDRHVGWPEWKTGLDARNMVSGAEPAIGPELSARVEQVRAALPDADRARFEQDPGPSVGPGSVDLGPPAARPYRGGLVAGGGCASAGRPAVGGD